MSQPQTSPPTVGEKVPTAVSPADLEMGKAAPHDDKPLPRRRSRIVHWAVSCFVLTLLLIGPLQDHVPSCSQLKGDFPVYGLSHKERAHRILATTPLIDGHIDLPILIRALYKNHINDETFRHRFENGTLPGHLDLPRLRQGQTGGAFWSVFAECPSNGTDFSDENYAPIVQFTYDQIDMMSRLQGFYPKEFSQEVNSATAREAFAEGKLISPMGIEGLHQIGNKASNLRLYHKLGVKYATLTHNCHNRFADAALTEGPLQVAKPRWNGVSPDGQKLVHELNRIGMIVDISHTSDDTMRDVLAGKGDWEGSLAPVIYSHSSAWSVCPHPRNVKDDILRLVKKRNSVVMVNIAPDFIACRFTEDHPAGGLPEFVPGDSNLDQVVKHITHIGDLIGYDHVGIGSDFDGIESVPEGLEDVTKYPDLVAALLARGVSERDVRKVVGENVLRVWAAVEKVAAELQAAGAPILEDE